jgi:uncharacterized repeat protein (TIGR03943 family)
VTPAGGTITLLVGVVLLRLTLTGTYARYVRVGMEPFLIVAGVVVIVLGLATLVSALRGVQPADAHGHHDHGGGHGLGVGWLLLAPIAALLLVAPPTLGSYGVGRAATLDIRQGAPVFHRLIGPGPTPMSLLEFGQRAYDHRGVSFHGSTVQLTGFAAGADGPGFRLARYQIACCAADAEPVVVRVVGTVAGIPGLDQWVTVTGTFRRVDGQMPELAATSVVDIPAPNEPYE